MYLYNVKKKKKIKFKFHSTYCIHCIHLMAPKIFGGDMPELMERILNNLDYEMFEIQTLYSCALVNRYWCKMTIPILWKDSFTVSETPTFISNYLSSLNESGK